MCAPLETVRVCTAPQERAATVVGKTVYTRRCRYHVRVMYIITDYHQGRVITGEPPKIFARCRCRQETCTVYNQPSNSVNRRHATAESSLRLLWAAVRIRSVFATQQLSRNSAAELAAHETNIASSWEIHHASEDMLATCPYRQQAHTNQY